MKIFFTGCVHGHWERILDQIDKEKDLDLIIVAGDSNAFRTKEELSSYAKEKFDEEEVYGTFHLLWEGKRKLPCPMIITGGNNECEDTFLKLPYGGYIMPDIFYAGRSSILEFNGLRIASISGIFCSDYYNKEVYETVPLKITDEKYTAHFIRAFSPYQIMCYSIFNEKGIDILMTHDWPSGIPKFNKKFFSWRRKDLLEGDMKNDFGLPFGLEMTRKLCPKHYFAVHHHLEYKTTIKIDEKQSTFFDSVSRGNKKKWFL